MPGMTYSSKLITALLATCAALALAACGDGTPSAAPTLTPDENRRASASATASPAERVWANGTYKVGEDIAAGEYKTTGASSQCYWNRLSNTSGESSAIIARDIFTGATRFTVDASDKYIKFGGACKWTRA